MLKKIPPYQLIGWAGSIILVIAVAYFYQINSGRVNGFWMGLMSAVSFTVLLMAVLEIWRLVTDYQAGHLHPMRNMTFFVVCLSVVALPVLGLYGAVTGQSLPASTMLLIPVLLFMAARNVFHVKIDSVALEAKTGFRAPYYVPLFDIEKVEETDRSMLIKTTEGKEIRLFKAFFFPAGWEAIRKRLSKL